MILAALLGSFLSWIPRSLHVAADPGVATVLRLSDHVMGSLIHGSTLLWSEHLHVSNAPVPNVLEMDRRSWVLDAESKYALDVLSGRRRWSWPTVEIRPRHLHGEARQTPVLWLASLGYLIALEAIGTTVCRPGNHFPRNGETDRFIAGAREFAEDPMSRHNADALYALRSSLAHAYSLDNTYKGRTYRFALDEDGPLLKRPPRPWDGVSLPDPVNDLSERLRLTTRVNVHRLAVYVEGVVENLRNEHSHGRVRLLRREG